MEKTYLGSVYINHAVRPATTSYYGHDGGDITIGDSEPGYQLPVIPYKDVGLYHRQSGDHRWQALPLPFAQVGAG